MQTERGQKARGKRKRRGVALRLRRVCVCHFVGQESVPWYG